MFTPIYPRQPRCTLTRQYTNKDMLSVNSTWGAIRAWGQLRHYFSLACPKVHVFSRSRELDLFQRNKRLQGQYLISQFAGSCVFFASSKTTPKHDSAPPGQVMVPPAVIGPLKRDSMRALYFPCLESQVRRWNYPNWRRGRCSHNQQKLIRKFPACSRRREPRTFRTSTFKCTNINAGKTSSALNELDKTRLTSKLHFNVLLKLSRTRCGCCKLDITPIQQNQFRT